MMNKNGFSRCAERYIEVLKKEGRYATAHVYKNALYSFKTFCDTSTISFSQINRGCLRRYGQYLLSRGLMLNTISTYMRMLRSIYNRGVEAGQADFVPHLFREVFTGVDVRQKKALPADMLHRLLYAKPDTDCLRRTQIVAGLLFQFSGMSFADFAHMEKSALEQNVLRYHRQKTGSSMCVEVLDTAWEMMKQVRNHCVASAGCPDYLFQILSGTMKKTEEGSYKEYQSALRRFNEQLKRLARALHIPMPVTSYTFRHSWATIAKYRGVPIEMISESLGHKSIKTTQIYLKGFDLKERTKINRMNISYIKNAGSTREYTSKR